MERDALLKIREEAKNTPLHKKYREINLAKNQCELFETEDALRKTYMELIDNALFDAASDRGLIDKPIEANIKLKGTKELAEITARNLEGYYKANKMNFSYDKKEKTVNVSIAEAPENGTYLSTILLATKIRTDINLSYDLFIKTMNELRTDLTISAINNETMAITAHKTIILRKIDSFIDRFINAVKEEFEKGGIDVKTEVKGINGGNTMITITATITE